MHHFDPVSLRLFVAICEEQSLTEAADRENLTVSTVSKRLSALEEQLGVPLLERGRGGVSLTAAGEALLPSARGLLQSMARIQANLSEYARSVPGRVRVAAALSAITSCLPADIAVFVKHHPNVRVSVDEHTGPEVVLNVEGGRADLGVCWDATGTRRLRTVPYRVDHMVVITHKEHELANRTSVSFVDTLPYERVAVDAASVGLHLQQRLAIAEGKALKMPFHVRTYDAACRFVAGNLAIAIVPKESTSLLVNALGLTTIALSDDWARRRLVLCVRDYAELNAPARHLLDALAARPLGHGDPLL
ncbi:LysR family transcriptional regulator [Variovorax saccharolyticus]|uniref:LysR family transcriptional regulator n=1 Tax=Variovorax saccharolyticus TaxID=3053516 RepID=UPI0025755061|nr:LysR family transcriptional regulator [Variovorax sp. J22R187]MDM0022205.1 LysR family transcriptional regulator [Variovorax sp. J22R187]